MTLTVASSTAQGSPQGSHPVSPIEHLDEATQFDLFSHDVKAAVIACAKLLSCYHGAAHTSRFQLPSNLLEVAPSYPYAFKALEGGSLFRSLSPATRSGLKGFTYYLGRAREEAVLLSGDRSADVAIAIEVTSTAACFAKLAVADILAIERRQGHAFEIAQWSYLVALLDDVIEGRGPLWMDGRILEVRSDFRLRERRLNMTAVALVVSQQREEQVVIINLSRGGLGFQSAAPFEAGQCVEIKLLQPARIFAGQIMWRIGSKVGVKFAQPLPDDDPLLHAMLTSATPEGKGKG